MNLIVSGDRVFYTLQGEGVSMGMPATFLRLHHCNLECVWCDTPYTWNRKLPEFKTEREVWSLARAVKEILSITPCHSKRLVITGGEPLIQQKAIIELVKMFCRWVVEIETNGTIVPNEFLVTNCRFNCSPKLGNSQNTRPRIVPKALHILNRGKTTYKFVVRNETDVSEMERDFLPHISKEKIILMPEGRTAEEVRNRLPFLAEIAKERGYRLLPRLQLEIWGDKRRT